MTDGETVRYVLALNDVAGPRFRLVLCLFELGIQVCVLIFFFCSLKLSIMTPMKRLSVKNEPRMMKKTK